MKDMMCMIKLIDLIDTIFLIDKTDKTDKTDNTYRIITLITFRIKIYFDIALSYINILLNYMRIQALYALTGIIDIYILLNR